MSELAQRLNAFGQRLFGDKWGWKRKFAQALKMSPGGLELYLSGKRTPGPVVQAKLRNLGADVEWIMTGIAPPDRKSARKRIDDAREATRVYFSAPEGVSDEVRARYERLAELIARVPPDDTETIEAIVKAYLKSAQKGEGDDRKGR